MQAISPNIHFSIGNEELLSTIDKAPSYMPFAENSIAFLHALSKELLQSGKKYSDVMTFAFWCRKANTLHMKAKYQNLTYRRGRGTVFHIAPSNVPINFAFSLASAILAGNSNIVRLPSKKFPEITCVLDAIKKVLKDFPEFSSSLCILNYEHNKEITDFLSQKADTRMIWGGNETIANIRTSPLLPRANEITFANRYSLAVIDSKAYLEAENKEELANHFYNDTYFSDQNACTAPRMIFWRGDNKEAKDLFYKHLQRVIEEKKYVLDANASIHKLSNAYCLAAKSENRVNIRTIKDKNNIYHVDIENIQNINSNNFFHSGFFIEHTINNLAEIIPLCENPCQTIVYYGVSKEEWNTFLENNSFKGIDRIVPFGQSMNFSLVWDGVDLIYALSREISL